MEIRYLKEFVCLAESCNFQVTADALNLSQSALSKHIKKMEEDLGVLLLDRTTRSAKLTDYGNAFYEHAKQIADLCDECQNEIDAQRHGEKNNLLISFLPVLEQYGIVELIDDFLKQNSGVNISLLENPQPKELLRLKKCDFAFSNSYMDDGHDERGMLKEPYIEDYLVAVLPSTHPLAIQKNVTIEQLRNEKFIMHTNSAANPSVTASSFAKFCQTADYEPRVLMTISFTSTIAKLVSRGTGIAVMNHMHVPDRKGIVAVDIYPRISADFYLFYRQNWRMTSTASAFLQYIDKHRHS